MHADTLTLILIMEHSRMHPSFESWQKGYMDQNDVNLLNVNVALT